MGSRPTIQMVAERAGVSISTVSRVMNGSENVIPEYADRVRAAISELSWRPNVTAQSLRRSGSRTLGLILPNTLDPFFGSIADSVISNAAAQNFNVMALVSRTREG